MGLSSENRVGLVKACFHVMIRVFFCVTPTPNKAKHKHMLTESCYGVFSEMCNTFVISTIWQLYVRIVCYDPSMLYLITQLYGIIEL